MNCLKKLTNNSLLSVYWIDLNRYSLQEIDLVAVFKSRIDLNVKITYKKNLYERVTKNNGSDQRYENN